MPKQLVTFTLRDEYADRFDGGNVAMWDGTSFDVKAALDAGGGKIVLDPDSDEKQIQALAGYRPLTHEVTAASTRSSKTKTADSGEKSQGGEQS
jgi:hypothetical protein